MITENVTKIHEVELGQYQLKKLFIHQNMIYTTVYWNTIKKLQILDDGDVKEEKSVKIPPGVPRFKENEFSSVYAYDSLFIVFFHEDAKRDIWCLDARHDEWYKSELKAPYINGESCCVIDGGDNYVYFVGYGNDMTYNFKMNLFYIIPPELHTFQDKMNGLMIHGFINEIANDIDKICPTSLIDLVFMYYPQFLYL